MDTAYLRLVIRAYKSYTIKELWEEKKSAEEHANSALASADSKYFFEYMQDLMVITRMIKSRPAIVRRALLEDLERKLVSADASGKKEIFDEVNAEYENFIQEFL